MLQMDIDPQGRPARTRLFATTVACDHIVQFYEGEERLFEIVAEFLAVGLGPKRQPLVAVVTEPHRKGILRALALRGEATAALLDSGRLVMLDARETLAAFLVDGMPDRARFRATLGPVLRRCLEAFPSQDGIRAFGEMVDLLWQEGRGPAAVALEVLWNELAGEHRFSLLCAYRMTAFGRAADREAFDLLCQHHSHVLPTEGLLDGGAPHEQLRKVAALQQRALALETELEERRTLELALREALDERQRAAHAREEFLAMLGHELRNPLSPILTALKLMQLRLGDAGVREREMIERQVNHLVRLVDDLLNVSRITQGKLELRRAPLQLSSVVSRALELSGPLLEERRHRLEIDVARGGLEVDGDEDRLVQVVSNLISNAAKYTEPEGQVDVRAWREGAEVVLSVRDTGIGLSPELLPQVFELFVQGPRSLDRSQGGLGLGLPIVRSLAQLHGGSISVHSDGPGTGSTFTLRLPACSDEVAPEPTVLPRATRARPTSGRRILVVDDNQDAAEVLAETLALTGYVTRTAFDGKRALAAAAEFQPELALLDIGLPVMDGYELAARLRALPGLERLRLVAVTGYGQDSDRLRAERSGFDAHLVKPVDCQHLEDTIDMLLAVRVRDAG